ncbi:MAG: AsmA-like C-terminal domain-containing protein [Alphaproteobacteria bacterium]|nr:AsmA-like C-terminal domain-containing protein [Alphaproteobacteria bacterium]
MIVRSSRALLIFFAAALVGMALTVGALFVQLNRGPIGLSFLTPVVERTLNATLDGVSIRLHDTVLAWESSDRALDIRATGLQVLDGEGVVQATIPEMTVTFSARALLRGLIAPTKLELLGPRVKIVRTRDGQLNVGFGNTANGAGGGAAAAGLVGELLRPPNPDLASGYLSEVSVSSALIEFEDLISGRTQFAPRANIALVRDEEGVRADGSVVVGDGEEALRLDLSGIYRVATGTTDVGLVFSDVAPSGLAIFDTSLSPLERLRTRVDGTLTVLLGPDLKPLSATADLRATPGQIDASPSLADPIPFESIVLRANAGGSFDRVSLESLELDLGRTVVGLMADAVRAEGDWRVALDAEVRDLPVDDIAGYWPPEFEDSTRSWITGNIQDGIIDTITVSGRANIPDGSPGDFSIDALSGEMQFRGTTVHYLRPLEPILEGAGRVEFDTETLEIEVAQARLRGIVAESGRIVIEGLSGPPRGETIKIETTVAGPVRDALEILDSEPLGFISDFGIDPTRTSGTQRTSAVFAFPLLDAIKVEEIAVATNSRLTDFSAEGAAFGLPVSRGDLTLKVDRDGMEAVGTAEIDSVPLGLTWTERFNEDGEVRTRYEVRTALDSAARTRLGFDTRPFVDGTIGVGLTYSVGWDDASAGAAEIDLTESALSLEPFGWTKPSGTSGRAFVRFHEAADGGLAIPEIQVSAADLRAAGSARFEAGEDGLALRELRLSDVRFGENSGVVAVDVSSQGVPDVSLAGESIDLRPIVELLLADDDEDDADSGSPVMRIRVSEQSPIGSVRLGEETRLLGAHGVLVSDGTSWSPVQVRGRLSNGGRIFVEVVPDGEVRQLRLETDDAGGLLRAVDWVDTVRDGELRVTGTFRGTGENEVLTGRAEMQGFVLTEEPFAAKMLALASFSGIGDVLRGDGITFDRADVPFELTENEVRIIEAKARGAEIGIVASGRIDRNDDTIQLEGEIAPAKTLKSLLANIPLIGQVLYGG